MNNLSKGSGSVTAIIVLVVIIIVGWLAYSQGLFNGSQSDDTQMEDGSSVEVNVGA